MMLPAKLGAAPSQRETQVAIALLFGRSNKQIARDLGIDVRTVETHRQRLYIKFGAHSGSELAVILMRTPTRSQP